MARGRKPQPAAVNDAKGNPGRRRRAALPMTETAPPSRSSAPSELGDAARRIWDGLAPELTRLNFLRDVDRAAFARYCVHLARWWDLTKDIADNGESYISRSQHGELERVRPAFLVRERIEKRLESLEDRFGLNPAARQQILQRLAGLVPAAPTGNLFEGKEGDDGSSDSDRPPAPPSPVGLLGTGSVH